MNINYQIIILILSNYLIGSVSSAIIITKLVAKTDIRKIGYKTAGGSNVSKCLGIKWGILVGLLDILKGIPIILLAKYLKIDIIYQSFIGISVIIGHCWPIWFNFSGGRGVGTLIGIIATLTPKIAIYPILIFIFTLVPYFLKRLKNINIKYINSPSLTLISLITYIIITLLTEGNYDEILSISLLLIILIRRVSARINEYTKSSDPLKLMLNRLIFDNNNPF